jgi:uncharacterized protein
LDKDVTEQARKAGRTNEKAEFGIFVLHNKDKPKRGTLPEELMNKRYWAAETIPDLWVEFMFLALANESASILGKREIL